MTTFIRATARVSMARPRSACTAQSVVYRHDSVAPTVVSVSPANDASDVQPAATLSVEFSELIVAQTGDVEVRCAEVLLPGTVSVAERRLTFSPLVQLWMEETCTTTVRTSVRDQAGNALAAAYSWSFTTRPFGWSPGPVVATSAGTVRNVEVGLGSAGDATLVWQSGQTTRHDLNPALGVSTGLRLNDVASQAPVVSRSPNGHAVIAWVESSSSVEPRIQASVFIPGTGWTTPVTLSSSTSGLEPNDPQVAIDNTGHALVVFRQHATTSNFSYSLYARRYVPGSGWLERTEIDGVSEPSLNHKEASVTRDGRGGFLVVWNGRYNHPGSGYNEYLFFNWLRAGSTPASASWSGARYLDHVSYPGHPKAGCDAQGNCTVVFKDYFSASDYTAKALRYDATRAVWGDEFLLGPTDGDADGVGVAVNANGQVVAAFSLYSSTLGDHEVMVRQYEPGVGWELPVIVGPRTATRGAGFADVGIDAQGNAIVLSRRELTSSTCTLFASRFRAGVGWLPPVELDTDVNWGSYNSREQGPRVAMNASGQALVAYAKGNTVYSRWLE